MRRIFAAISAAVLVLAVTPVAGAVPLATTSTAEDEGERETYVVTLHDPPLATYTGGIAGLAPTSPEVTGAARLDPESAASVAYLAHLAARQDAALAAIGVALGRTVEADLRYDAVLNGLTVALTGDEASTVAGLPTVRRVDPEIMLELHTDNGPAWIGAEAVWAGGDATGGADGNLGEGVVVGVIDTGVNFRHPAFAEVGPVDGHVHENPRDTYFGLCDPVTGLPYCNDKLIGMWDFVSGVQPQDDHGHGSHVASTAAGNVLEMSLDAPTVSIDRAISGVAPHANLISYKACVAIGSCPQTGTLGSINQATLDGVDVVNFSIGGGPSNPWSSLLAEAFLNARAAGVFVATSAGNDGPGAGTVGNPANAPWVFSVGASTHDRDFPNVLADLGNGVVPAPDDLSGKGLTAGMEAPARVVYAGDYGNALCGDGPAEAPLNPFSPGTFDGEIVVCDRGTYARVDKAEHVAEAGAGGFVLANDEDSGDSLNADPYVLPGVHLTHSDGEVLKAWIEAGGGADNPGTGIITGALVDESPENGDVMAGFSSRGPNAPVPDVIKPDITAPGVDILAAWEGLTSPTDPETYNSISGTSMSSPHAAGAAALIRSLQPEWTPDQVKSALMTTSFTDVPGTGDEVRAIVKHDGQTPADPFDRGAGRIDLRLAALAGLLFDETVAAYEDANPGAGGDPATLNLPSLASADCEDICSWTRTITGAVGEAVTWQASADVPDGVQLTIEPAAFTLAAGDEVTVTVTADVTGADTRDWQFAEVAFSPDADGVPDAHLPVALRATGEGADDPEVDHVTLHFRGNQGDDTGCTGDGRLDISICGGPFLQPDGELSDADPARFGPVVSGVDGTAAQNIYDPNWTWHLDEPTTVGGPMTVHWWAGCPGCGVFSEDWTLRLWADGEVAFEERITATGDPALSPSLLEATITVPEITADETLTLHVDPVFVDTQHGTFVYYDSTQACPGGSDAPCDSFVLMPVPAAGDAAAADLTVVDAAASEVPSQERAGPGDRVRMTATVANIGEADAPPTQTEFWVRGDDRDDLLGWVATPPIPAGEQVEVEVSWDTRGLNGDYVVTITSDILDEAGQDDRGNDAGDLHARVRGNRVLDQHFEPR